MLARAEREAGNLPAGLVATEKAWHQAKKSQDMPVVALCGLTLASLTLAGSDAEAAARLLGASDSVRGAPDLSDPEAKKLIAAAREAIGERADLALAQGRKLSRPDAIALLETALLAG
jgi:hypothetical protein